jgi:hypothetical protein
LKTKTLTLNEEQFNIVFRALKDYYHHHPSESFAKEIDQVIKLLDTIPYNEEINQ